MLLHKVETPNEVEQVEFPMQIIICSGKTWRSQTEGQVECHQSDLCLLIHAQQTWFSDISANLNANCNTQKGPLVILYENHSEVDFLWLKDASLEGNTWDRIYFGTFCSQNVKEARQPSLHFTQVPSCGELICHTLTFL